MILAKAGVPSNIWPGMGAAGGLLVLALAVATVFLWRNMNHQIKKVKVPTQAELLARDRAERQERQAAREGSSVNGAARPPANGRAPSDQPRNGPSNTDQR